MSEKRKGNHGIQNRKRENTTKILGPEIHEFAVCTSRNRLPAAVAERPLRLYLHSSYKELTGDQDETLQCSFHHSTQMESTTVTAGK